MGRWEALMGSNTECYRHLPGGSDLHLSRRRVLIIPALDPAASTPRASWPRTRAGSYPERAAGPLQASELDYRSARQFCTGDAAAGASAAQARASVSPASGLFPALSTRAVRGADAEERLTRHRYAEAARVRQQHSKETTTDRNETDTSSDRGRLWAQRHAHLGHLSRSYT